MKYPHCNLKSSSPKINNVITIEQRTEKRELTSRKANITQGPKTQMIIDQAIPILVHNLKTQSILLYGSYAHNLQDEHSDFDLLILAKTIPTPAARKKAYDKIPNSKILEIDPKRSSKKNGWDNSWTPVNDKLLIGDQRVEIGFNTTAWADSVLDKLLLEHQTTFKEFSFRPYTFLGLLETCKILYDNEHYAQELRTRARPFPEPLKAKIIQEFLPILVEAHEELKDYSKRQIGILAYQFHLFRALDALIQLVFVVNDTYDPSAKRIEPILFKLKRLPPHFENFINVILPRFYEKQTEVSQFLESAIQFINKSGSHP